MEIDEGVNTINAPSRNKRSMRMSQLHQFKSTVTGSTGLLLDQLRAVRNLRSLVEDWLLVVPKEIRDGFIFLTVFLGWPGLRAVSGWPMMRAIKRLLTFFVSHGGSARSVPPTHRMPDFPACQWQVLSSRFGAGAAEAPGSAFW